MEFNAVAFLEDLYEPRPWLDPDDLPGDWRCVFEERAAIMEGGYPHNASYPYILWFPSTSCRYGVEAVVTACCISR